MTKKKRWIEGGGRESVGWERERVRGGWRGRGRGQMLADAVSTARCASHFMRGVGSGCAGQIEGVWGGREHCPL